MLNVCTIRLCEPTIRRRCLLRYGICDAYDTALRAYDGSESGYRSEAYRSDRRERIVGATPRIVAKRIVIK
jgi:hypothetical protein